ncbi:unnamed protein product [Discula destructiva]
MNCFPLYARSAALQDDEKSPAQDYRGVEACTPGGGILAFFGSACPPTLGYAHSPPYQSISPGGYDAAAPRAYSADLRSPSDIPQLMGLSTHSAEQSGGLSLVHADFPAFTERHPTLQPTRHPEMHYPTILGNSSLKMGPPGLKIEDSAPDSREANGVHTHPMYMRQLNSPHHVPGPVQADPGSYNPHTMDRYQTPSYGAISAHGFVPPGAMHVSYYPLVSQGANLPVVAPNQKPEPTKRGPFSDPEKRARTAMTRKIGSCIRCRMQRIRCESTLDSPDDGNAPCECCKKISANSKIHRMPCRRWKLTDVRLSKPGNVDVESLRWTHRWKDTTAMPDITQWQDSETKDIILNDGLIATGVRVKVRRFKRLTGDLTERTWYEEVEGKMRERKVRTQDYALVDVAAVKVAYEKHLSHVHLLMLTKDEGFHSRAQMEKFKELLGPRDGLLWKTYQHARQRRDDELVSLVERDLLSKVLDLWVAVRLTTRSFEISGKETLGIEKANSKSGVVLPPVMGKQLDKLLLDHTLTKLRRDTLEVLQKMTQEKKQKTWLTTYLVSFMLLHNVSLITDHDMRYAKKHAKEHAIKLGDNVGKLLIWARPHMVQQYHLGANILLAYFHYCNRGTYPFSDACKESDLQNLAELDKGAIDFVRWTRKQAESHKVQWQQLRTAGFECTSTDDGAAERHAEAYSNPYFFVSQLYGK